MLRLMRSAMVVVVLLGVARVGWGKNLPVALSIGANIVDSDCVVRGVVRRAERVDLDFPDEGHSRWWKLEIDVRETFKGVSRPNLTVFLASLGDARWPDPNWETGRGEYVFFLVSGARAARERSFRWKTYAGVDWTESPLRYDENSVIDLEALSQGKRAPVVSDSLTVLRSSDEVLEAMRRAAAQLRGTAETLRVDMPRGMPGQMGLEEYWLLKIAVTDDSCAAAREWVRSGDFWERERGARVLALRCTEENIAALRRFFDSVPGDGDSYETWARAHVLAVMKGWGVKELPGLTKRSGFFDGTAGWISVAAWLLVPGAYVARRRRKARLGVIALICTVTGLGLLGARSCWLLDGVTWGNVDVAAERGEVYVMRHERADAGVPSPLTYCRVRDLLNCMGTESAIDGRDLDPEMGVVRWESYAERFAYLTPANWMWGRWGRETLWRVPIWGMEGVLVGAWGIWLGVRWWKRWRERRRRGFPVEVGAE